MKILITGSEGFLGRNLVRHLKYLGLNYFSIGIKDLERENHFKISSINDYTNIKKALELIRPDLVFHLAGSPLGDSNQQTQINFEFSKILVESLKELNLLKSKLIVMGTAAEYGLIAEAALPVKENHVTKPFTDYGKSKLQQSQFFLSGQAQPLNFMIIRPFNIYGPGMPDYLSISNFVNQIKLPKSHIGSTKKVLEVGNLDVERDFLYIDDFIQILWDLSQNVRAYDDVYNVCSGYSFVLKKNC